MRNFVGALVTIVAAFALGLAACDPDDLLGPGAPQGIEGIALLGPICPVQTEQDPCPDQPHEAWVRIRDSSGSSVVRFRTGNDGRFRVGLRPGRYRLEPESGDPFPIADQQDVVVEAGTFTQVVIHFDTGIR